MIKHMFWFFPKKLYILIPMIMPYSLWSCNHFPNLRLCSLTPSSSTLRAFRLLRYCAKSDTDTPWRFDNPKQRENVIMCINSTVNCPFFTCRYMLSPNCWLVFLPNCWLVFLPNWGKLLYMNAICVLSWLHKSHANFIQLNAVVFHTWIQTNVSVTRIFPKRTTLYKTSILVEGATAMVKE